MPDSASKSHRDSFKTIFIDRNELASGVKNNISDTVNVFL